VSQRDLSRKGRIIFLGLDGASWNILQTLLEEGRLPYLLSILKRGFAARIQSMEPLLSSILWTTITSGKLPDKHGVKDFYATTKSVRCKRIWDIVQDYGYSVGLLGELVTWPPWPLKGFNIPDLLAQDSSTFPPGLCFVNELIRGERIRKKIPLTSHLWNLRGLLSHGVTAKTLLFAAYYLLKTRISHKDTAFNYFLSRVLKLRIHTDLFINLINRMAIDYGSLHVHLIDSCSHYFWRYYEPEKFPDTEPRRIVRYSSIIPRAYEIVDSMIGRIFKKIRPDILIIVSDHGSKANVSGKRSRPFVIKADHLFKFIELEDKIRYSNIRCGLMLRAERDDPQIEKEMIQRLGEVRIPDTGQRLFQLRAHGYNNFELEANYDIQDFKGFRVEYRGKACPVEELLIPLTDSRSGAHDKENAVLIMCGSPFKADYQASSVYSITDILPTLLYALGIPVGRDMDGKVIEEAFDDKFLRENPISYVDTHDCNRHAGPYEEGKINEEIRSQLRDLGYL